MRIGLSNPSDVLAFLVRRRWWIIGPFLMMSCAVAVITKVLPKTFVSESLILVRPRDVPANLVMDLISGSTEDRLKAIQQTVLSRSNIVKLLNEFGPRLTELRSYNQDEKVERLRSQIHIDFRAEKDFIRRTSEVPYFKISYQSASPDLAQKLTASVTRMFIELDNQTREDQVNGSREFLQTAFEGVEQQLQESDSKIKEIKMGHQFELPEQLEMNQRALDRLQQQREANGQAIERTRTLINTLEAQIAQTEPMVLRVLPQSQALRPTSGPVAAPAPPTPPDPLIADYLRAKNEFEQLSSTVGQRHPDLVAAKARLDRATSKLPPATLEILKSGPAVPVAAPAAAGTAVAPPADPVATAVTQPNPVYAQLTSQLAAAKTDAEIQQREKQVIAVETERYNRRVENAPATEMLLTDVMRQNADLKRQYDEYKAKLTAAQLSESLESKQKGAQFLVIDEANYPIDPAKPNKVLVLVGGCGMSLVLALLFALVVDIARQRVWSASEIEKLWGAPVLVDVPQILTDLDLASMRRRRVMFVLSSAGAMAAYAVCLYGLYLKRNFVLQRLDPILQKLLY